MEVAQVVTAGGVLAILLAVMFYNQMQVARSLRRPKESPESMTPASMLGRYATHRGHVVGQVVAVESDKLVLRQGTTHKAVPMSQAKPRDGDVTLEGAIDWAAAEEAGRAWARLHPDPLAPSAASPTSLSAVSPASASPSSPSPSSPAPAPASPSAASGSPASPPPPPSDKAV